LYVRKTRGDRVLEQAVEMEGNREIRRKAKGYLSSAEETIGYATGSKADVDMAMGTNIFTWREYSSGFSASERHLCT
jgi:hypothetical protein